MDVAIQQWIDAGLFDPDAPAAVQTAEVLAFYTSVGVDAADFAHVPRHELVGAVNMSFLRSGATLDGDDVRERSGLSQTDFDRLAAAAGYPGDGPFTERDVEAFAAFAAGTRLFSADALSDLARVVSGAMARIADATSALFRIDVAPRIEASGDAEVDYARQNYESSLLIDGLFAAMQAIFLQQLTGAIRLSDQARQASTSESISTVSLAVGFVDIVGYTSRSATSSPDDLAGFIVEFERRATAAVNAHGGRLVKLIGDAIMYVAVEAETAVRVATSIVESFSDSDAIPRGGVASGEVIGLGGDYYGSVVNMAARMVDQAVPAEVLVDAATAAAVDSVTFVPAGRRQLKGFSEPIALWAVDG